MSAAAQRPAFPPFRKKEPDTREKCQHCGRSDCDEWACLVADIACPTESPAYYTGEGPATSVDDPLIPGGVRGSRSGPPALDRDPHQFPTGDGAQTAGGISGGLRPKI
jgi:hypothetical protein